MLQEGENIYHSHIHNVPKYIKLINIKILKKLGKDIVHQCTIRNLRPKNAKNHLISLLQM
jgi:hypothetical protein